MKNPEEFPSVCHRFTLPNGLRIIHEPVSSRVAYCGFAVDAGTRDEDECEHGMAHFVEHLLFKGTRRRKAWHILNRMENVGGDLNAYTNKEETVVYCAFPVEHFARAFELLADIVFHSTFPQSEVEKETEVIIDEIQSYEDSPSELIFDDFENLIFRGHPLGHNILGTPERLKTFRGEDAASFTARHYRPERMVFFVRGEVDFRRVLRLAERFLADIPPTGGLSAAGDGALLRHDVSAGQGLRLPPPPYEPAMRVFHRDTHQAHVMIGARAYDAYDPRRTSLYLLTNLLGGPGMNSRLNVALRERRGLVYSVEANLLAYTDTGAFCIYFGCDPADTDTCIRLVYKELQRLRDRRLTPSQLAAAKKQLIGQLIVASDNAENNALSMAKTYLHYDRYETMADLFRRIEALTSDQLLDVAGDVLATSHLSTLLYD